MKLKLSDLNPRESTLILSNKDLKPIELKRFSLRAQEWLAQQYSKEELNKIFATQNFSEISKIVFYLIKDKSMFETVDDFKEEIATHQDRVNLIRCVLDTIGISQPLIDDALKEEPDEDDSKKKKRPIGVKSSTSSRRNTASA